MVSTTPSSARAVKLKCSAFVPAALEKAAPETPFTVQAKGYQYKKLLKSAAFANVYLAYSSTHGKEVAVKHFRPFHQLGAHYVEQCLPNELMISSAVRHPNLMTTYEVFHSDSEAFMSMLFCGKGTVSTQKRCCIVFI